MTVPDPIAADRRRVFREFVDRAPKKWKGAERTAWARGYVAGLNCQRASRNPFLMVVMAAAWNEGWLRAHKESGRV